MTDRTRQATGMTFLALGLLLLMLSALDYVLEWRGIGTAPLLVGIALLVVGAGLAKRPRGKVATPEATVPKDH